MKIVTGILLFLCVCDATGQETRAGELAGRAVEMIVVKAEDLSPVAWPPEQIELKQISATVTHDKNIYMLLQDTGIAPDPGAFALVYDLNPTLRDVNALASGYFSSTAVHSRCRSTTEASARRRSY